jgi:prepilin-type N-terminal cleavage/methylation domain-containing protein
MSSGFTLVEVVISAAVLALVVEGVMVGYARLTQQAEWSSRSLAAQALACQSVEQARAANWDLQSTTQGVGPGQSDELGVTSYVQTNVLGLPLNALPTIATNFVSITTVSVNPPVRQICSECVWSFMGRGPFTNTAILWRAPDQ